MQIRLHCVNFFRRKILKMNGSFQKVLLSGKSRCYNYNSNRSFALFYSHRGGKSSKKERFLIWITLFRIQY